MLLTALFLCVFAFSTVKGQSNGQIRLVTNSGSTITSGGRLEIFYRGQWGTVCNDGFGSTDARVVCRELGYTYFIRYGRVGFLGVTINKKQQVISTNKDARVVCRELGYTTASRYGRVGTLGYTQASNSTPIWLDEVRCSSSSSALRYCSSSGIGIHNCGHYEDVAVICSRNSRANSNTTSYTAGSVGGGGVVVGLIIFFCVCAAVKKRRRVYVVTYD